MSINGGAYQEPRSALLSHDSYESDYQSTDDASLILETQEVKKTMRSKLVIVAIAAALLAVMGVLAYQFFKSTPNHYHTFTELNTENGRAAARDYYKNHFSRDMRLLTQQWQTSLNTLLPTVPKDGKALVILDIDDTLIDNFPIVRLFLYFAAFLYVESNCCLCVFVSIICYCF